MIEMQPEYAYDTCGKLRLPQFFELLIQLGAELRRI